MQLRFSVSELAERSAAEWHAARPQRLHVTAAVTAPKPEQRSSTHRNWADQYSTVRAAARFLEATMEVVTNPDSWIIRLDVDELLDTKGLLLRCVALWQTCAGDWQPWHPSLRTQLLLACRRSSVECDRKPRSMLRCGCACAGRS